MAVMMPGESWTDERLDDLNQRVDDGFKEMREEFRAVRSEMRNAFQAMRGDMRDELGAVRGDMREIRVEIGALNRTVAQLAFGLVGAILIGFLGTIAAIVTLI
jgi:predicted phage gp36 major capsid-like protein